jgi:hypothetical protein
MEINDRVEEDSGDRGRSVGMAEGNEMCHLGELVNYSEDNRLAIDARKTFYKVHRNISPDSGRHVERLKKAGGMKVLVFVPLACDACPKRGPARSTAHPTGRSQCRAGA